MKRYTPKPQEQLLSLNRLREVEQKLDLIAKEFHQQKIFDPEKIVLDHFEFMALFKISRRTSQYWRAQSKISHSLIGGRIYFTLADIQRLLQQHKVIVKNSEFRIQNSELAESRWAESPASSPLNWESPDSRNLNKKKPINK